MKPPGPVGLSVIWGAGIVEDWALTTAAAARKVTIEARILKVIVVLWKKRCEVSADAVRIDVEIEEIKSSRIVSSRKSSRAERSICGRTADKSHRL